MKVSTDHVRGEVLLKIVQVLVSRYHILHPPPPLSLLHCYVVKSFDGLIVYGLWTSLPVPPTPFQVHMFYRWPPSMECAHNLRFLILCAAIKKNNPNH